MEAGPSTKERVEPVTFPPGRGASGPSPRWLPGRLSLRLTAAQGRVVRGLLRTLVFTRTRKSRRRLLIGCAPRTPVVTEDVQCIRQEKGLWGTTRVGEHSVHSRDYRTSRRIDPLRRIAERDRPR